MPKNIAHQNCPFAETNFAFPAQPMERSVVRLCKNGQPMLKNFTDDEKPFWASAQISARANHRRA
jgi:hypothetical protein